jgi:hypothetical protein
MINRRARLAPILPDLPESELDDRKIVSWAEEWDWTDATEVRDGVRPRLAKMDSRPVRSR